LVVIMSCTLSVDTGSAVAPSAAESGYTAEVVVLVAGVVREADVSRLRIVLDSLRSASGLVVVDVAAATTHGHGLIRTLCRFRSARRERGRMCRLRGLHPGILPELEEIDLPSLAAVHEELLRDSLRTA
jgi:hypothetical protein